MTLLPNGFATLEPFAATWAIDGSAARAAQRGHASAEDRSAFHAAMSPLILPALALLDAKPLADHDTAEQRLMQMCLAFAHIALAVETQGEDEAKHTPQRDEMIITRTPADA